MSRAEPGLTAGPPGDQAAEALEMLHAAGGKRTALRAVILEVLAGATPRHLTVAEIYQALRDARWPVDLSAVYRSMATFTERGVVHALGAAGAPAYGLSNPPHHHAICQRCGVAIEIPSRLLRDPLATIASVIGSSAKFKPDPNGITVHGTCRECQ